MIGRPVPGAAGIWKPMYLMASSVSRKLSLTRDVTSAEVLADAELLRLAMLQLLDNACKYSPSDSAIKVGIERQHEFVAVRVWNGGSSIASNERTRVFERFYRGANTTRRVSGTGMGLSIAKGFLAAERGRVWAENRTGGGAQFTLAVPVETRETVSATALTT